MIKTKQLIMVYTGNGKGKTTAALGLLFRALGNDFSCAMLQFIKADPEHWGEFISAKRAGVLWENYGKGFTYVQKDLTPTITAVQQGWARAKHLIMEKSLDLLILDEFTYPLKEGWVNVDEVCAWLEEHRTILPHIVITGRYAPEKLVDFADMVSELTEIKHHAKIQHIPAQRGIEF